MQRRDNLTHFMLASVVALGLTPLMVVLDAQARIVFQSNRDGHVHPRFGWPTSEIYVMEVDGKNQRRLINNPASDYSPSWSPDGKRIAFVSERAGHAHRRIPGLHTSEIYVMDADGSNQLNLTNNLTEDRYPAWSPDGEHIAFSARREGHVVHNLDITYEIYVMDADRENEQRLTENRHNDMYSSWSPNGERIAFVSDRKGNWENYDIYVMDADGGNQQKLTNHRDWDSSPSWSPDGKQIVFTADRSGKDWNRQIYVMDADGENLQNLTNNPGGDRGPAWFNSPFSVAPVSKKFTIWGRLKRVER